MNKTWRTLSGPCKPADMPERWGWRDSDLGRLAMRAAAWMSYDQEVVKLCRHALLLGFTKIENKHRSIMCAGYLHGEACSREAWELFWEGR